MRAAVVLLLVAASAAGCAASDDGVTAAEGPMDEPALRRSLGVPDEAKAVLVFAQNAHLDIDWQRTFDDYYARFVGALLVEARELVERDPRAFYSIAEMAYLDRHLAEHPEEAARLAAAAARGQLHVVGGGMTSPDTLLPEGEVLFRDWLYGSIVAEGRLGVRPTSAWLPDSFGHGGTAPDVLAAAGFDSVAFSRIDGALSIYERIARPTAPPHEGSSASALLAAGSADFVWQGEGGAEVLATFLASPGLYCMGDDLDYDEPFQVPGGHLGAFHGDASFTDARIDKYAAELAGWARTPYRFVPVGCDFAHPKDALLSYLDGYNARRYPTTGVWATVAPYDVYAKLVGFHRDALPRVKGELSPYYMGFYGSRAAVKRAVRDAAAPFLLAEPFAALLGDEGRALQAQAAPAFRTLTLSDHHDFVTGTSADAVVADEELPWLATAQAAGERQLAHVAATLASRVPIASDAVGRVVALHAASATRDAVASVVWPIVAGTPPALHAVVDGAPAPLVLAHEPAADDSTATFELALAGVAPFSYRVIDVLPGAAPAPPVGVTLETLDASGAATSGADVATIVVANARVRVEAKRREGSFALTSVRLDGVEALAGDSFALRDYDDDGGLWRLGHEMPGCALTERAPTATSDAVRVVERSAYRVRVALDAESSTREIALDVGALGPELAVTTGAAPGTTRTVVFAFATADDATLRTSGPGGYATHPLERVYAPTFWPAVAWASFGPVAVLLGQSTGVRAAATGEIEWMLARDARAEKCDMEGGTGTDTRLHRIVWRLERAASPAEADRAAQDFDRPVRLVRVGLAQGEALDLAPTASLASVEGDAVISTIKPAERGEGAIVRALLLPGPATLRLAPALGGAEVVASDLTERDSASLGARSDAIALDRASRGSIVTLRVR